MSNRITDYSGMETVLVHFEEEDKLKPQVLSSYLYHSKITYSFLHNIFQKEGVQIIDHFGFEHEGFELIQENRYEIISEIGYEIPKSGWPKLNLATKDLGDEDLYIESLNKESPFSIEFVGLLVLILIVIAIGGGEAKLTAVPPRAEIKMQKTLGEGLQDLKEVFREGKRRE